MDGTVDIRPISLGMSAGIRTRSYQILPSVEDSNGGTSGNDVVFATKKPSRRFD